MFNLNICVKCEKSCLLHNGVNVDILVKIIIFILFSKERTAQYINLLELVYCADGILRLVYSKCGNISQNYYIHIISNGNNGALY